MKKLFLILLILIMGFRDDNRARPCVYSMEIYQGVEKDESKSEPELLLIKLQG